VTLTVRNRAETVATLRSISITLMETLARWVPTTPTMEIKVLFGRHIWEFAQHADMLGKRTYELRAPLHLTLAPVAEYAILLRDMAAVEAEWDRVAAVYDVALPAIATRCRAFIEETDPLLDEPTVRIMRRIIGDYDAMIAESKELRAQLGAPAAPRDWVDGLSERERVITKFVAEVARG
jgi:hypothetical protein